MKTRNTLIVFVSLGLLALGLIGSGCKATLEQGGMYSPGTTNASGVFLPSQMPDLLFYQTDAGYSLARGVITGAFDFEYQNRALLWKVSPNIKHALDQIRPLWVDANNRYLAARAVYLANPVPAGLSNLQTILSEISRLATSATAAIPASATVPAK